ncbi:DUF4344 domain-containing metallopeptidase [Chitinilyticum piscinae]|uniref:Uncharacterized protein n=1 Tax=Chitinilyticum piscinae TaxID=2866724 RepID=A0A8J7FL76_9NEIS|nr:DUF4344 domain-containing metallopeptidase [Chitinilyticum piscinae]MBE9608281.1 hypothetical protein [Chitinilyticum piscinae]
MKIKHWLLGAMLLPSLSFAANVITKYTPPQSEELKPYYELLKSRNALDQVKPTVKLLKWPGDFTLETMECGEVNAMYYPGQSRIVMCYEIFKDLHDKSEEQLTDYSAEYRRDVAVHAAIFLFRHELTHAIIDVFKVPIFTDEENAADAVALYYSLNNSEPEELKKLLKGAKFYFMRKNPKFGETNDYQFGTFSDVHPLHEQRYFNMLCYTYAKYPKEADFLVKDGYLPQSRADYCPRQWEQLDNAMKKLIWPHTYKKVGK